MGCTACQDQWLYTFATHRSDYKKSSYPLQGCPLVFLVFHHPPAAMNGLSGKTVLNVVPSLFATALKHYSELVFEQATPTSSGAATGDGELGASTLKDDLKKVAHSYDQMFALAKVSFPPTCSLDPTLACGSHVRCSLARSPVAVLHDDRL